MRMTRAELLRRQRVANEAIARLGEEEEETGDPVYNWLLTDETRTRKMTKLEMLAAEDEKFHQRMKLLNEENDQ